MISKLFIRQFILVYLVSIFLPSLVNGQKQDSGKIIFYGEQVIIRVNLDTHIEDFVASGRSAQNNIQAKLSVNNKIKTAFSLDYKIISAAISLAPAFIPGNHDDDTKGKSSYSDIRFRLFPGRFIQSFNYRNIKGFYLANMTDFIPGWRKGIDPYLQFPDLRLQTFGGSTAYILNRNFSLKSIYHQREWQKNSSGSIIPMLEYDLSYYKNISEGSRSKERQINLGLNFGYYYNWVIAKKINVAPYVFIGAGGKWSTYRKGLGSDILSIEEKNKYLTSKIGSGIQLGFNSSKFFFGGRLDFNSEYYREDSNSEVFNNGIYGQMYFGYRFAPPKYLKKTYEKVQRKIGVP